MGGLSSLIVMMENALYPFKVLNVYLGRFFGRFLGSKSRSLSLAARIAIAFFFCFALFITIAVLLRRFSDKTKYQLRPLIQEGIVTDILYYVIAAGIAVLVYWGVRLATRDKPSLYPEIDRCWNSFDSWREKQALDWFDFNRFLVLGTNLPISKAMHAEMKDKKVDSVPGGANEWMHWFGTTENLYLHLKKISHINERLERIKSKSSGGSTLIDGGTLQVSVGAPGWSEDVSISGGQHTAEVSYGESVGAQFGASLDPNDSIDALDSGSFGRGSAKAEAEEEQAESWSEDDDTRAERVEYLVKMMRLKTSGEVPFHGVVVTIPFDKFIQRENYKSISSAIRKDLLELREHAEVSFPVAFVFTSMEKDQGFPKLQNLLGGKRASTGRFGAGCKVEDIPTVERKNLELQIARACNSFEDWVINRWAKSSQLARAAQNKELYKLVIRIRQQFRKRLEHLLDDSLIWNPSESPNGESTDLPLAGCYFVSTGENPTERGFLAGVFAKCEEFSETSSWSGNARSRDQVYSVISSLLFLFSLLIIAGIGICLFMESR